MDNKEFESLEEKGISSTNVFSGHLLHVFSDDIVLPNGEKSKREYIKHVGASCVVPITKDRKVIVERQFRYPLHSVITEIPAGKLNYKEEDPLLAAKRELKEETGYTSNNIRYIGPLYPSVAYTDETIHMYVATDLTKGERNLDEDEFLNVELIPLDDLVKDIMDGKIADSKTQIAIMKAYILIQNGEIKL